MDGLPLGAHITTPRFGYLHHGIYAGEGRVIHYPGYKELFRRGLIEEVSFEQFTQGRGWQLRSWPSARFSGQARVDRARSRLGENSYRFWSNNCEHFVHWCITGTSRSPQVELQRVFFLALGFAVSLFSALLLGA